MAEKWHPIRDHLDLSCHSPNFCLPHFTSRCLNFVLSPVILKYSSSPLHWKHTYQCHEQPLSFPIASLHITHFFPAAVDTGSHSLILKNLPTLWGSRIALFTTPLTFSFISFSLGIFLPLVSNVLSKPSSALFFPCILFLNNLILYHEFTYSWYSSDTLDPDLHTIAPLGNLRHTLLLTCPKENYIHHPDLLFALILSIFVILPFYRDFMPICLSHFIFWKFCWVYL